ncbi:hypothetical protein ACE1B6_09585 [Aerosakkonemataceae cyanobacterium BLCC-F154]|uniref:Uncharacterized protein n=1 Tax=Floridaenema fluviatile BLCC-F154 TaxID=3153640 RepID=A0ABV4YC91_9CYAN
MPVAADSRSLAKDYIYPNSNSDRTPNQSSVGACPNFVVANIPKAEGIDDAIALPPAKPVASSAASS